MRNLVLFVFAVCILFASCKKDLMVDHSIEGDYKLFFEYLKNDYAYRNFHSFTMTELEAQYLPQIQAENSQENLAEVLLHIVNNELKDPHVFFTSNEPYNLANNSVISPLELDQNAPLFKEVTITQSSNFYTSGYITSNPEIGYIYINAFNSDVGGSNSLGVAEGVQEINTIIEGLNNLGVSSMIVDMRSYAGGSNYVPRYIAQRFADKEAIYMNEYFPVGDQFEKKTWTVNQQGDHGFRVGKIALLSNGRTCSGGEFFLLAMLQRGNLVHIGSRSFGCAGNVVHKDLSNGWNFSLTNSKTEFPDGKQYFQIGIIPEIIATNGNDYGISDFSDELIIQAIEELQ